MAWTWYQKLIAIIMVVTGSVNTLATKWADRTKSVGADGQLREFDHPFLQACSMFLGELMCLFTFKILYQYYRKQEKEKGVELPFSIQGNQNFNPFIFYIPAVCDMLGTSIMYIGLNLTYASSFQMLRGSVIIFTGLFSVAFLNRHLKVFEWLGIAFVIVGLICVGMSDVVYPSETESFDPNSVITGDLLIILAQIVVATQMVVEEKFITKHNVNPLQGVGWEGLFGFLTLSVLLVPMYYIKLGHNQIFHNPDGSLEDAIDGFIQIGNNWQVATGVAGTVFSIAFFNFAGLSVTKELSATTRMVLDSIRTFVVWIFTIAIGWEKFNWLQLLGFFILFIGMCLYNDVIIRPLYNKYRQKDSDSKPLLKADVEDETKDVESQSPPDAESTEPKDKYGSINT